MRAIVERDCVDFDVDAGNARNSRDHPPAVLEAAIACRERAPSSRPAEASPPAPPAAVAAPPAPARVSPPASTSLAPVAPPAGSGEVRVRAIFIGESGKLACACTLDGRPIATLTKEAQGEFGQAVDRAKILRESNFVSAAAGRHVVGFVCDPNAQEVTVNVDLGSGDRRTVEIAENTFRRWKLRKIDNK